MRFQIVPHTLKRLIKCTTSVYRLLVSFNFWFSRRLSPPRFKFLNFDVWIKRFDPNDAQRAILHNFIYFAILKPGSLTTQIQVEQIWFSYWNYNLKCVSIKSSLIWDVRWQYLYRLSSTVGISSSRIYFAFGTRPSTIISITFWKIILKITWSTGYG